MDESKSIICRSSFGTAWKHDVFVSFRGEDTRNNFVDHLFGAFRREGIAAFRDDTNLKQGDHISKELMEAIEGSHVLIVVFSKNYANSSWCLDELAKIVDCIHPPTPQTLLPVFYDVTPSVVRRQSGDYAKAFAKHEQRIEHHLLQRWRKALVRAADLSGCDVQNKPQYERIENIVKRVKSILGCKLSSDLDGLVGMDSRIQQLENLLVMDSNDDIRLVGISGMGGIGKSTLARAVYDRNLHRYAATCFIDDISKVYRGGEGRISAQKQLIHQALKKEIQDIWNVSQANNLIKSMLCHQKALIVVDNVDDVDQLEELSLNRQYLCAGSRIIICSRDKHVLKSYGVDEVYDAQILDYEDAHKLFCEKAFKHGHIMSDDITNKEFEELMDVVLEYTQGLPLAIKVLGSFLYGRDISQWRSTLNKLRKNPEKKIMHVLRISFDNLRQDEKEIFLHIACFLDPWESDVLIILNHCGFHLDDIGISVLVEKSLIRVVNNNIEMHNMLQELGKDIVREEATNEPGKWSRIWRQEDFQSLMFEKMAMDNIQVIKILSNSENTCRAEALSRMNRLRVLILYAMDFSGSLPCLSSELRYLHWRNYPFNYFPSSCELIHLVELHLNNSNIEQLWEDIKRMEHLKVMNLSGSKHLVKTPDFTGTPNLERLELSGCIKLAHIHPSIGHLKKLVDLDLGGCTSLTSLPNSICDLSSLELVFLGGCSKLFKREGVIGCRSRFSLFKRLKLTMWPFNIASQFQMPSLARLYLLRSLDLSFCGLLNIPEGIASLFCLESLILTGNNFVTLPCFIEKLPRLRYLDLDDCKQLTYVYGFPLPTVLPADDDDLGGLVVRMFNCAKLVEMESLSSSAVSWMRQFLKVHKDSSTGAIMVIPVSETKIPWWFKHQSVGESITTGSFPSVHDTNWIGVAFCATFVAQWHPTPPIDVVLPYIVCQCWARNKSISRIVTFVREKKGIELVHFCLLYFTRQELINHMQREMANMDVDGLRFKVYSIRKKEGLHFEVKNCGVRVIFKQDLEEINGDG